MRELSKMLYWLTAIILLLFCCLGIAGCGRQGETEEIQDIFKETEQLSYGVDEVDTSQMIEYAYLGSQFWQGERIQLWGMRRLDGCSVYLHREDGSRELLAEGIPALSLSGEWWIDSEKRCFAVDYCRIRQIDSEGKAVFDKETEANVYSLCQLEDGRIIVLAWENGNLILAKLDPDSGSMERFQDVQLTSGDMIAPAGEKVLLLDQTGVWDVSLADGKKDCILSFEGTSYALKADERDVREKEDFRLLEDGSAELLWSDGTSEILKSEKVDKEKEVLVFRIAGAGSWIKEQVVKFNQENTDYYITIEEAEDEGWQEFRERTDLELGAGRGADIICSDAVNDACSLLEKGVFEDLAPYMEASGIREEDYFPMAFSGWRRDEKIYGLSSFAEIEGIWVKQEVVGDAEITDLEKLLDLLLAYDDDVVFLKYCDEAYLLQLLLENSENLCGMVDLENGTCDFDGELFRKLLETAKKYGYNEKKESFEAIAGKLEYAGFYAFLDSRYLEELGRAAVGYWFGDGWHTRQRGMILAVNGNSSKKEGAWEFLKFLLADEVQMDFAVSESNYIGHYFPVGKKAFEALCREHSEVINGGYDVKVFGGDDQISNMVTGLTEDRTKKLYEALENARTAPTRALPLLQIILEESEAYFSGGRSIEEVRDIVENRVRLYLNERQ